MSDKPENDKTVQPQSTEQVDANQVIDELLNQIKQLHLQMAIMKSQYAK